MAARQGWTHPTLSNAFPGTQPMAVPSAANRAQDLRVNTTIRDFGQSSAVQSFDGAAASIERDAYPVSGPASEAQSSASEREIMDRRRPSINFDDVVTLDSGRRQSMAIPLERPTKQRPTKQRPRGRSMLQEISDEKTRLGRAHSESDQTHYDPVTGRPLPQYATEAERNHQQPHVGELRHPLLQVTVDEMARESHTDLPSSFTSQSTLSPHSRGIRTPQNDDDYLLSPTSFSPPQLSHSFDEPPTYDRPRRNDQSSQPNSLHSRSATNIRNSIRNHPRRSTSPSNKSPGSAASSWLRGFSISSASGTGFGDPAAGLDPTSSPTLEGLTLADTFVLGRRIGFGGFSTIHEATQLLPNGPPHRALACKCVRKILPPDLKSEAENDAFQAEFSHEVDLWRSLHHPHILPLEAVVHTPDATYCFIPLNIGGTLFDTVRANRGGLPLALAKIYAFQLATALRYLHRDAHVAHRDVKLENCLLSNSTDPGTVRLCDFGMAEWLGMDSDDDGYGSDHNGSSDAADRPPQRAIGPSETSSLAFAGGSVDYAAPEILRIAIADNRSGDSLPRSKVSTAVDIWAFGVCVYTLVVGKRPFYHAFQPRMTAAILAGDWNRAVLRSKGGEEVLACVSGCLEMDAPQRWNVDDVLACEWLWGMQEDEEDEEGREDAEAVFDSGWKL